MEYNEKFIEKFIEEFIEEIIEECKIGVSTRFCTLSDHAARRSGNARRNRISKPYS